MRILFLTSEFPYPARSGATIKTASILDYLRGKHAVRVLCFHRRPLTEEQSHWAREVLAETVPLNRGRNPLNLARSYLRRVPLSIERNRSPAMTALVSRLLAVGDSRRVESSTTRREARFDAVFVDGWLMAQYLPLDLPVLKVLHQHNAEHLLWDRQAQRERNPLLRPLGRLEHRRVRAYEASILGRFDAVFAVSDADRRALRSLGADAARLRVLPNLPDRSLLDRPQLSCAATERVILYHGTLSWQPNLEGLGFLLREVLPLVRDRLPETRLVIAGEGAPRWLRRSTQQTDGAELEGPVDDAEPLYRRARVFVEASRTGGGTRLKVLNALARGLPVVASPEGAEGLDAVAGEHLLVAKGRRRLVDAVLSLMADDGLWQRLSENGRALVRARYLAERAYRPLDEVLSDAGPRA